MSDSVQQLPRKSSPEKQRVLRPVTVGLMVLSFGGIGFWYGGESAALIPTEHQIVVRAHQYGYSPAVIRVNRGDTVRLRLLAEDVTHGFYLEGYDIDATVNPLERSIWLRRPSRPGEVQEVEEIVFTATKSGKFRYRCSQTCGYMHAFMLGELVVEPNRLFSTSVGIALGMFFGGLLIGSRRWEGS